MAVHALVLGVYLAALMAIGAYKARRVRNQEDFSLAGRRLSTAVLAGTLLATWIGTGSIFGNAEEAYRVGLPAFLLPISGGVGILVLVALAPRIRRCGQFTIQDILEARFGVVTRILGTLTLVAAYVIIVSYQYRAGAAVVERILPGLDHTVAVAAVALFVILYTALAGMYSVAYTDVANGVLMTAGIFIALPILVTKAGGWTGVAGTLPPGGEAIFGHYPPAHLLSVLLPALLLIIGDANMYQRFFSAKDPASARRSAVWMFAGVLTLEAAIIATALAARALVVQGRIPEPDLPGHIIAQAAFHALPPWVGALLAATLVAVILSTADSYLLAPSTSLVRDVYERFIAPGCSGPQAVAAGRVVAFVLGLSALALAFTSDRFFSVALFAYTIYGAGITPVLMAALFWRGATRDGAVASMVTGVLTSIGWKAGVSSGWLAARLGDFGWAGGAAAARNAGEAGIEAVLPALAASLIVLFAVSRLTRRSRPLSPPLPIR